MPLSAGTTLGPYEIVAPLGAGGMGEVWKARDTRLDRIVAVKVSKAEFSERFEREARAVAALNHPNICQLYDVGPNYLVMEYVEGTPLKGSLPVDQALKYAAQICDALDAAHKKGITHRDLKPANILVTKAGIKLLDFGLAKIGPRKPLEDATLTMALTGKNEIVGTLYYMSPEQLQAQATGQEIDARSDIFSFGLVLYEMLTGKRAFDGASPASVIAAIMERPAPSVADVAPPALDRVLKKCLAKHPDERWQTARDLGDELQWIASAPSEGTAIPATPERHRPRWIAAVVALAIGAGSGWLLHNSQTADRQVLRFEIDPPEGGKFTLDAQRNGMALSPEGTKLAYVASGKDGINRLWIRALNEPSAKPMPGTEDGQYPFWSQDGKTVGFFNTRRLMRIDLDGSGLQPITDATTARGGAWLEDGRIVFGSYTYGLRVVSATGGEAAPLTKCGPGEGGHRWPQALPGGRLMYFVGSSSKREDNAAYVISLNKPEARNRLMSVPQAPVYVPGAGETAWLLWQRGTALVGQAVDRGTLKLMGPVAMLADPVSSGATEGQIYATASKHGPLVYTGTPRLTQFTWYDRSGRVLGTVGAPGGYHFGPFRISPDQRTIAASLDQPAGAQMGLLEIERGIFGGLPLLNNNSFPAWGPDSRSLAYGRAIIDAAKGSRIQTIAGNPWDWSPDGRRLIYRNVIQGLRNEIMVQVLTPDRKFDGEPRVLAEGMYARFSADGRWVAFQSPESGADEVYIIAFSNPQGKVRVSTAGGNSPVWSPDGREIYYVQPGNKLMAVSLKIIADSVQPAVPKELFVLPVSETPVSPFDFAKDGRFLVRADVQEGSRPLSAIVNWQALVK